MMDSLNTLMRRQMRTDRYQEALAKTVDLETTLETLIVVYGRILEEMKKQLAHCDNSKAPVAGAIHILDAISGATQDILNKINALNNDLKKRRL